MDTEHGNSDHWERLEALFCEALERDLSARAAFLDEACADRPALRREVEQMLEAHDRQLGIERRLFEAEDAHSDPALEGVVGPYRVVREIGQGGMGKVYLAERADHQFQKRVALKVVKRGMDTDEILHRFRSERQILASLDHPGIARLLDGGMTEDGRPFFVMEYVEDGVPLTDYCDQQRLSVDERLDLFGQVCNAVQFAHQNLVVHRDLKPSNILVSEQGTVKLLDFGIAKLLDPDLAPFTLARTRTEMRMMTPEYAAPEQVGGETITTTTDVYQLGVLLYELLAGHRPYRLKSRAPGAIAQVIREEAPEKPSLAVRRVDEAVGRAGDAEAITPQQVSRARATDVDRLARRLRGDLDTIVLKAMRKEPQRRYASVAALADDVRRHLRGMPVAARPNTLGYRTRTFVRRHRLGVTAAAAVFLVVLGFGIVMAVQASRIARQAELIAQERDRARLETQKAEQVTAFLADLFKGADPTQARDMTARELLDAGSEKIDTELAEHPSIRAQMLTVVGSVYRSLGLYEKARAVLEEAVDLYRKEGETSNHYATSLLELANLEYREGHIETAAPLLREALVLKVDVLGDEHPEVAKARNTLALVLEAQGRQEEAIAILQQVIDVRRKQSSGEPNVDLAANLNNLANLLHDKGQLNEADTLYRETLAIIEAKFGPEHPYIAYTLNSLAGLHQDRGAFAEAREALERTRRIAEARLGAGHPFTAVVVHNLGRLSRAEGDLEGAEARYREAVTLRRSLSNQPDLAESLRGLGQVLLDLQCPEEAVPLLDEAVRIYTTQLGVDHERTRQAQALLDQSQGVPGTLSDAG